MPAALWDARAVETQTLAETRGSVSWLAKRLGEALSGLLWAAVQPDTIVVLSSPIGNPKAYATWSAARADGGSRALAGNRVFLVGRRAWRRWNDDDDGDDDDDE